MTIKKQNKTGKTAVGEGRRVFLSGARRSVAEHREGVHGLRTTGRQGGREPGSLGPLLPRQETQERKCLTSGLPLVMLGSRGTGRAKATRQRWCPPPPPAALGLSGLSYHMGGSRSNPPSDSIGRQGAALAG